MTIPSDQAPDPSDGGPLLRLPAALVAAVGLAATAKVLAWRRA